MNNQLRIMCGHTGTKGPHANRTRWSKLTRASLCWMAWELLLLLTAFAPRAAQAQTQIGTSQGHAAFDHSGSVYFAGASDGVVYKATYTSGTFSSPVMVVNTLAKCIAVDADGNLYIAGGTTSVRKETLSNGSYSESVLVNNVYNANDIALDGSGNLYVMDGTHILMGPAAGTSAFIQILTVPSTAAGMTVDSTGNLYVADSSNNRVLKFTLSGGSYTQSVLIGNGLSLPLGVALDSRSDLYIADYSNGRVLKETPATGGYTPTLFDKSVSGDPWPASLTVSSDNSMLAVRRGTYTGPLVVYPLATQDVASADFTSLPVGTSASQSITMTIARAGTIDRVMVMTLGNEGQDYANGAAGTCATGTVYIVGDTCTLNVMFSPKYAGMRKGAVTLLDALGNPLSMASLYGTGTGSQISLDAFQTVLVGNLGGNSAAYNGLAVDAAGNVYVADHSSTRVLKETLGSGGYTETVLATGLYGPWSVAVDGAGAVYVTDMNPALAWNNDRLLKFTPDAAGTTYTQTVIADGLENPKYVGTDMRGNVYVTQGYGSRPSGGSNSGFLSKLSPLSSGAYTQTVVLDQFANGVSGFVVDPAGSIYFAQNTAQCAGFVFKAGLDTNGDYAVNQLNLGACGTLALDGAGQIYTTSFASGGATNIYRSSVALDGTVTSTAIGTVGDSGAQLALDGAGNIYVGRGDSSTGYYPAAKLIMDRPSTVDFGASTIGQQAVYSSHVIVGNIGTDALTLVAPTTGSNPGIAPTDFYRSSSPADTCIQATASGGAVTLSPAANCSYYLNFKPSRSGVINGTMTFTDNDRSVANATQTIALTGAGPAATASLAVSVQSLAITQGTASTTLTAGITYSGSSATPANAVSFTVTGGSTVAGTCVAASGGETCTATYATGSLVAGSFTITASIAADATYSAASGTGTLTVNASTPKAILSPATGSFGSVSVGTTSASQAFTLTSTGDANLAITSIGLSGANAASFRIAANTCGSTLAPGRSCEIDVAFTPAASGNATATLSVVDNAGTQSAALDGAGTVLSTPQADLSPTSVSFGNVNVGATSVAQTFTLKNAGNAVLPITSVSITGTNASLFVINSNTCGSSLSAGGTCTIGVYFKPSVVGSATATLSIVNSVGTQTSTVTGTGVAVVSADFGIAVSPAQQTVSRGSAASFTIQLLSSASGTPFANPVTLTVSGLPVGATATFSPSSLVPGTSQASTSALTVTVPSLSASLDRSIWPLGTFPTASLGCVLLLLPLRRKRNVFKLLVILVASLACVGLTACGGTGFAAPGSTSTIVVTASSGSTTHTTTITLKVN